MDALAEVPDYVIVVAAVLTALGVIWRKFVQPTARMLQRIEASLSYVESEMKFNGGATQRDAIKRIDEAVRNLDERLQQIEANTHKTSEIVEDIAE